MDLGYQGCFHDRLLDQDMSVSFQYSSMTIEWCINTCLNSGYSYAGLQVGDGRLLILRVKQTINIKLG